MAELTDSDAMPFGKKHLGERLGDVPASYLLWCYLEADRVPQELINYIEARLEQIEDDAKRERAEWFEENKHGFSKKRRYRRA